MDCITPRQCLGPSPAKTYLRLHVQLLLLQNGVSWSMSSKTGEEDGLLRGPRPMSPVTTLMKATRLSKVSKYLKP